MEEMTRGNAAKRGRARAKSDMGVLRVVECYSRSVSHGVAEIGGSQDAVEQLLTEMPQALSTYGTPSHRLEEAMGLCAAKMGVQAEFFSMPTAVLCSIGAGAAMRTHIVRVMPGDVNLEKLDRVDEVLGKVFRREVTAAEALAEVREIRAAPVRYAGWMTVVSCGVAAACAARFFGGAWVDAAAASVIGLIVGVFAMIAARRRQVSRVTDFASGFVAAALANLLTRVDAGLTPSVVTIASVIVLVPGLTLTVAINELATRNLVAGTSRLMGALMIFLSIGFGVGIGQALTAGLAVAGEADVPMPAWSQALAIAVIPFALTVLFRARPRDIVVIVPAAAIGYYVSRLGATWAGPEIGAFVGAIAVGLYANGYSRVSRRPTAITMVPGLMMLVPGSIGFRSVSSFLAHDAVAGVETAFLMVMVATAIVTGLLLANVLLASKQSL